MDLEYIVGRAAQLKPEGWLDLVLRAREDRMRADLA